MTAIPLILAVSVTALPFAALSPATPAPTVAAPEAEAQQPARVVTPTPTPTPTVSLRPAIAAAVARGVRGALPVAAPAAVLAGGRSRSSAPSRQAALGLVEALRDADVGVRESAATGLGQLGVQDTAVVAALGRALTTDADAGVRRAAAWALGQLEQAAAVPALAAALAHDRDVAVRR